MNVVDNIVKLCEGETIVDFLKTLIEEIEGGHVGFAPLNFTGVFSDDENFKVVYCGKNRQRVKTANMVLDLELAKQKIFNQIDWGDD